MVVHSTSRRAAALLLCVTASLSACGSGDDGEAKSNSGEVTAVDSGGVQKATIEGTDGLVFSPGTVKAKAGTIELTLDVTGGVPHNLEIAGIPAGSIPNVNGHESKSVKFTATPGTYQLICTYHSAMRGTLIVAP